MTPTNTPNTDDYAVVGCSECEHLQIVQQKQQQTMQCRRCSKTHQFEALRKLYTTDSKAEAKHARALKLAERSGMYDQYRELLESGEVSDDVVDEISDEEFLARSGINPDLARNKEGSPSTEDAVFEAIEALDSPTARAVVSYVELEYDAEKEAVTRVIERLRQSGDLAQNSDDVLRVL